MPRAFAFVTFSEASCAGLTVSALDGIRLLGKALKVSAANPSRHELRALVVDSPALGRRRVRDCCYFFCSKHVFLYSNTC